MVDDIFFYVHMGRCRDESAEQNKTHAHVCMLRIYYRFQSVIKFKTPFPLPLITPPANTLLGILRNESHGSCGYDLKNRVRWGHYHVQKPPVKIQKC
jgi:hypothetical protein